MYLSQSELTKLFIKIYNCNTYYVIIIIKVIKGDYSAIRIYTDIECEEGTYRVLISKRASDIKQYDLFFDRYYNSCHMVKGIRSTTKKWKPAISLGLENFGARTYLEDDIVYCAIGVWDGKED